MVRIFIAIDLPQEIRDRIREAQEVIASTTSRLSLVDPRMAHITLKFIGEVQERMIGPISEAMEGIRFQPFELTVEGVGGNNSRQPRVVWAGVRDAGECRKLSRLTEDRLVPLGIRREDRPFTPHVTIARVKQFHPSLLDAMRRIGKMHFGSSCVSGISLKKSTLRPEGAFYEDLYRVAWL